MLAHVYTESVTWPAFGAVTIEHRIASHAVHKQIRVLEILFNQSRQLKQFRQFQVNDLPGRFILYDSLNGPQIYIKTSDLRYMCVCVCVCVCVQYMFPIIYIIRGSNIRLSVSISADSFLIFIWFSFDFTFIILYYYRIVVSTHRYVLSSSNYCIPFYLDDRTKLSRAICFAIFRIASPRLILIEMNRD